MPATVALLTDFGTADPYVGQMHGVLARLAPEVRVVDAGHGVEPFNLAQGAFYLAAAWPHFPVGTVFCAVVDPGVGGGRRILAVEAAGRTALVPDNGLAGLLLTGHDGARVYDLSAHAEAEGVSATFHGRDVFAPLAARVALGEAPGLLGPEAPLDGLVRPPWAEPRWDADSHSAEAAVVHVDRFGNCVLNLPAAPYAGRLCCVAELAADAGGGPVPLRGVRCYADLAPGEVGVLEGSQGYLELAMNQSSAAARLGLACGDAVAIRAGEPSA